METLISNVINGNLTDAKRQARRWSNYQIMTAFQEIAGYSEKKAILCADWLKGRDCYQAYCDAD